MSTTYQAVYDAVRSRIHNVDIGSIIERTCLSAFDTSHAQAIIRQEICATAIELGEQMTRPSVLFRPKVYADGDRWCALYGEDLMMGVCGFGKTPAEACKAFDTTWTSSSNGAEND